MRCFLAIDLPVEIKKELRKVQEQLRKSSINAKFVEPENLHLTLKFFGEVTDFQVNQIKEALKKIRFEKFQAKLGSVGFFSPDFVRVLWVSLEPCEKFFELHKKIEGFLNILKIRKEEREFKSHVTLARIKSLNKEEFFKKIKEIKVRSLEFPVDSFCLKKSILTEKGPIYENLVRFELT
ncbi:MAG: RNA 2',3'-cyclic phosphodiesterase [Candidatus Pacearchaeota archaeon]